MAYKVLGEAEHTLFISHDVKPSQVAVLLYVFLRASIQSIIVTSFRLGSLTLSTWFAQLIRLIILLSQILGIIRPSCICHGMSPITTGY